jgi:chromosome segregation protein
MRLESITLKGFKSFAERTEIKVLPGITAIVGPNGCGKSNISESVRWALGEQSAKSLRGTRMEDLIFHGSASRKAVGLAEVELTFANDGALAVPWSEVSVSRRLYRDGESEYLLNKSACRLRDIVDLFAGTGANAKAYSVMDQEKLNHVLTAKPYERRIFIEEAAGIARYKQQRQETQAKLEATRQNLLRVRDVMDEVKRQLGSLERQAKKAQQYKAWQAERQTLALRLLAADYGGLDAEQRRLADELRGLRDREEEARTRLASLGATEARQRDAIQETGYRLTDARQDLQKARGEFARLLERRDQIAVQVQELTEEAERLDDEVRSTGEREQTLEIERNDKVQSVNELEAVALARAGAADEVHLALETLRAEIEAQRERLEALRLTQIHMASERTDLTRATGELRERESQLERRAARLDQERSEAGSTAAAVAAERAAAEREQERARVSLEALEQTHRRLEQDRTARARRLAGVQEQLAETRVALAAAQSSFAALEQLERAREGYGAGVRAVFDEGGLAKLAGVVGTVADLLEVPVGLDAAIEAVLGERLQWVVVERFEHAREAVAFLGAERAGSATFVPLDTLPAPGRLPADESQRGSTPSDAATSEATATEESAGLGALEDGVIENGLPHDGVTDAGMPNGRVTGEGTVGDGTDLRWMAHAVRADSAALLHYLLGRVAVVNHLDTAETLWRRNGIVATYVTPTGEVLSPAGRLRGGSPGPEEAAMSERSLLRRKRTLRELEEQIRDLSASLEMTQAAAGTLESELSRLAEEAAKLGQAIQAGEAARLAAEKDVQQAQRELDRLARHLETIELELGQVPTERAETGSTLAELLGRIACAGRAEDAHEQTMLALRLTVDGAQEREKILTAELTRIRVEAGSAAERVAALRREINHIGNLQQDLAERLTQTKTRREQIGGRTQSLVAERERSDARARELAAERDRLEEIEREIAGRHELLSEELRQVEVDTRAAQTEVARLVAAVHDVELRATERRVRAEELAQEAWRRFSVEPERLLALFDPAADLVGIRERVADLEARLGAMGAVNLVADDEYRELDDRLSFLRAQHDDLVASLKDLDKALRGMTRTAHDRFQQAFRAINEQFAAIFERLFEGGRAQLSLVEPAEDDDPLEAGIELMAQPRGKRLQAVSLMSGGERALTGLALLFAIFYFRPSPFCVLDEVDAPLDDANIHRFLRVLRELCNQTQFLVITHNRRTMEAADVLYGVTMEEPGLSKLVSVNLAGDRV